VKVYKDAEDSADTYQIPSTSESRQSDASLEENNSLDTNLIDLSINEAPPKPKRTIKNNPFLT
jgi:hypothetical protein